jgi:hypothetical protein
MPKRMSIFSQREANASKAISLDLDPLIEDWENARSMYGAASKELFDLCYSIQVTGELPPAIVLTEALIQYRQARARIEALQRQVSHGSGNESLAGVSGPA